MFKLRVRLSVERSFLFLNAVVRLFDIFNVLYGVCVLNILKKQLFDENMGDQYDVVLPKVRLPHLRITNIDAVECL